MNIQQPTGINTGLTEEALTPAEDQSSGSWKLLLTNDLLPNVSGKNTPFMHASMPFHNLSLVNNLVDSFLNQHITHVIKTKFTIALSKGTQRLLLGFQKASQQKSELIIRFPLCMQLVAGIVLSL